MARRYLIIGGVAAGATAAARLRRLDEKADITIIEKGRYVSFANCGLPYFISGDITKRSQLLLQTPEGFWGRYRVQVLIETEALAIDRAAKTVTVRGPDGESKLGYDALILAQGGQPMMPAVAGLDQAHVFRLWTVPDMDAIHQLIAERQPESAVVVGGGFIGLEAAEAFAARGLSVTVVEAAPHILGFADAEFAQAASETLERHGVHVRAGVGLASIGTDEVVLADGTTMPAQLVLVAAGVQPDTRLAKAAGLTLAANGALQVDEYLQTSDSAIWAAGDMVAITHKVSGATVRIPLAGPANRQGRIAATNATGERIVYHGGIGTSVIKLFDTTLAATGLSERAAKAAGLAIETAVVHKDHHAGYYPGAKELSLKLVYEVPGGRLLGAQAFGHEGVEKRIDVAAMALQGGLGLEDLAEVDLAYAPPYSSANDPLNLAAFVGLNQLDGHSPSVAPEAALQAFTAGQALVLDVRTLGEYSKGHIDGAMHIPVDELRDRLQELPADVPLLVHCRVGYRAHLALRILAGSGVANVRNIRGGWVSMQRTGWNMVTER